MFRAIPTTTSRHILTASIAALLAVPGGASAATVTKANNANDLNLPTSWVEATVPGAADLALWNSTVTGPNTVSLGANLSWRGISITNPGGPVTINGANTLTLGTFGIDMSTATQDLTISSGLTIGTGRQVWNIGTGRTLTLNTGVFTRTPGGTLNIQGAGTVVSSMIGLANDASEGGGILGPWATIGTGADTAYATLSGGNIIAYTGGTTGSATAIPTGATAATNYTITTAASGAYGAATRTLNTLRNTAGASVITMGNSASQINMVVNGILNSGTGLLTVTSGGTNASSGIMIGANNNRALAVNAANESISLGRIIDNTAGASSLTVDASGANTVTLTGVNTYTGGTVVNSGTLIVGAGGGAGGIRGTLTINPGATTRLNATDALGFGAGTAVTQININGGTLDNAVAGNNSYSANWSLTGGTMTSTGGGAFHINAAGGLSITSNASPTTSAINANVAIRGADGVLPINVADGAAPTDLLISGAIVNGGEAGVKGITKNGAGTLVLTGASTYAGATTIAEGTLQLGDGLAGTGGTIANTSGVSGATGTTLVFNRAENNAAAYPISGGVAVTKLGAGTQTLTGANSYTGPTQISAGTMAFSTNAQNLASSAFTVADDAGLSVKAAAADTTLLTTGSLTLGSVSGSTLTLDFNALNTTAPLISTGLLTANGPVNLSLLNGGFLASGAHPLIDYTSFAGSGTFPGGTITLGTRSSGTIVNDVANTVLTLNVQSDFPKWTGLDNGNWQVGSTGPNANWRLVNAGTPTDYIDGDVVLFDDDATGVTTIDINAGNVSPTSVTFNNGSNEYTITSSGGFGIAGSGALIKSGAGRLTLSTANTYSGGTTLNAGTLVLNNSSAIGTGTLTINGGTLDVTTPTFLTTNNAQAWNGDFVFAGTADLDMGLGGVTVGGAGTDRTVTTTAGTLTVGELRAPTHGFIKAGAGTLVLASSGASGANDGSRIAGVLNVAEGTLQINIPSGGGATSGDLTVGGLTGTGTIVNGGLDERWVVVNTAGPHTFAGTLADVAGGGFGSPLGFSKQGTGTQTLSGALSYTGTTTLGGGTLVISGTNSGFGTNANVNSGTLVLANTSALGGASLIRAAGNNLTNIVFATDVPGNIYNFTMGTGTLTTLVADRATPGAGIEHVMSTQSGAGIGGGTINVTSGANVTSGSGRITFVDFGMGSGTANAVTTLNPTTANVTLGNATKSNNTVAQTLGLGGTTQDNRVTGIVSNGTAVVSVTKNNSSRWTLEGPNTYTGVTTLAGGVLNVASLSDYGVAGALGARVATQEAVGNVGILFQGGTLQYTGSTAQSTNRQVRIGTAGGTIDASGSTPAATVSFTYNGANTELFEGTGARTLTLTGSNTGNNTFAISLQDETVNPTSLTKTGAGTWVLTGANTYTGPTLVQGGTLITTPAQTGATSVSVVDGAGFGVRLANAGTTFNVGTLTLGTANGATLTLNTGGLGNPTAPVINATTFTLNAPTTLAVLGTALVPGTNIPLIDYTGTIGGGFERLNLVLPARTVGNLVNNTTDTRVDLNITQFEQIKWNGNVNGTWDADTTGAGTQGTPNWLTTTTLAQTRYLQGPGGTDTVNFDDSATGTTNINIATAVTPLGINFNNSTLKNYTFSSTGGFGIGGTGALVKNGTGSVTLNTENSYSGGTTLNAGTLNVNTATALGTGAVTINGGTINNTSVDPIVLSTNNPQSWNGDFAFGGTNDLDMGLGAVTLGGAGATRTVNVNGGTLAVGEIKGATHGLTKQGAGTLVVASSGAGGDGSVVTGPLDVAAGTLQINRAFADAANSGDFTATGLTGSGTVENGGTAERWLFVNAANDYEFSGTLANGIGGGGLGFSKQGAGTQTLSGTNSYTGATTLGGGRLVLAGANTGPGTNATVNSGTLVLANPAALGATSLIRAAGNNVSTIVYATDGNDNVYDLTMATGTVATIVSDRATPGAGIEHAMNTQFAAGLGGGTLNFTSGTNVTSGAGRISFAQFGLGSGTANAVTTLNPTTANVTLGDVFKTNTTAPQTLDLGGTSAGNLVTGTISDGNAPISVTKSNTSTWTLNGANTYTGATTVNGGTLLLQGSIEGSSSVVVNAGTLGGTGSIQTGLNVGDSVGTRDAILAPGLGIGTLSTTAGVSFGSDAVFALEINTSNFTTDLLSSTGSVSLNLANLSVTNLGSALLTNGETFTFLTGTGGVTGEFAGLPDGAHLGVGSNFFEINYTATSVQLLAVPEPATGAMLFSAAALLGLRRRRRAS